MKKWEVVSLRDGGETISVPADKQTISAARRLIKSIKRNIKKEKRYDFLE